MHNKILFDSTRRYLAFSLNFLLRMAIAAFTWAAVLLILFLSHQVFELLAGPVIAESTATVMRTVVQVVFAAAAALMTVVSCVDMVGLAIAQLRMALDPGRGKE